MRPVCHPHGHVFDTHDITNIFVKSIIVSEKLRRPPPKHFEIKKKDLRPL